ncbi:MAG: T9SS type A sorting domain-containing protein [Ignavibacteria bacterium]|nr:T9SS type A sorting domain-containing protein [Ignavibacteria bacterium]
MTSTAFPIGGTVNRYFIGADFNGSYTVGATGQYLNLTRVAAALTRGQVSGNTTFKLLSDYDGTTGETFPIVFNEFLSIGSLWTVTIRPDDGVTARYTSNGGTAPTTALISLNGADRIVFDGQGRTGGGAPTGVKEWTVRAQTNTNNVPNFLFINDARANTLTYLTIEGNAVSTGASGTIWFSTTTGANGNDSNTVSFSDIRDRSDASGVPTTAVYSLGTTTTTASFNSNNTFTNCNIYNYFNPANESNAFKVAGGNTDWTITNNSIYQVNALTATTAATHYALNMNNTSANNHTISGNFIGGSAPNCGGTPWTLGGSVAVLFDGMYLNLGATTASTIANNTIANFAVTTTSASTSSPGIWTSMWLAAGNATISGNTIGSGSGTGSVTVTTSAAGAISYCLVSSTGGTATISGNTVGSITALGATTANSHSLVGISVTGSGTHTITGNTVGSTSTANSLYCGTASTSATGQQLGGILTGSTGTTTITNNTVANLRNEYASNGTTTFSGATRGIVASSGINTITGNTVRDVSTASLHVGTGGPNAGLLGISAYSTTAGIQTVSQNTVHALSNSAAAATTISAIGIQFSGSTSNAHVIERNLVHGITTATSNTGAMVLGIQVTGGTATFKNNMVRLGTDVATTNIVAGISKETATNNNFYFNSVYIGGSNIGSGAAEPNTMAFRRTSTATDDVRNNVFFNARSNSGTGTGKHYAAYLNATTTMIMDYNVLFSNGTGSVLGFDGTTDRADLAAWKNNTPFDAHSSSADPQYVDATGSTPDLHISTSLTTPVESNGITISGITTDYDANTRNAATPDVGADEGTFTGSDLVPPAITWSTFTSGIAPRTLTATITDASGVPTSGSGLPVLYWKINAGSWTSSTGASIGSNQYDFTFGSGAVTSDVVYYYIVAQDNASTPNVIAQPYVGASGYSVNPPACSTPPTTPSSFTVISSISGVIHVGTAQTAPYNTLTAAIGDLNAKQMTGPVTFLLDDATYSASETFPIVINQNIGSSATNTLTIKPNTSAVPTLTGSSASSILKLNGADYVIIDGSNTTNGTTRDLTIENTSTSATTAGVWIGSLGTGTGAHHNTLMNCNVKTGIGTTASTYAIFAGSATSIGSAGDDNDNLTIQNNLLSQAYYGIYALATATGVNNALSITQNTIGSASTPIGFCAAYFSYTAGSDFSLNDVFGITQTSSFDAVSINAGVTSMSFTRNKVHDLLNNSTNRATAFYINAGTSASLVFANNLIYGVINNGTGGNTFQDCGFYVNAGGGYDFLFNSVLMSGDRDAAGATKPSTPGSCMFINTGLTGISVMNNIFVNTQTAATNNPKSYAIYDAGTNAVFSSINNNNYFVSGAQGVLAYLGADISTLAAWKTAVPADMYSVNGDPGFTSTTNLLPDATLAACWNVNGMGTQIASVSTDYAGSARSTTVAGGAPDIGAYEFTPASTPASATASAAPANSTTTVYTVSGLPIASITWGAAGTVPNAIDLRFYPGTNPPAPLQGNFGNGYVNITATGGSGYTYDIVFGYEPGQLGTISSESNIRLAKRDAGIWRAFTDSSTVNTTTRTVTMTNLAYFSDFALTDVTAPLPVQLVSFTASRKGSAVDLAWKTASELNSLRFAIERRASANDAWTEIGSVQAQGSVDRPTAYSFIDAKLPKADELFYRLRKIDRDGSFDYSNVLRVAMNADGFQVFANYPNPFNPGTTISFAIPSEQSVTVQVYDITGRLVETLVDGTMPAGVHSATFFSRDLPSGMYRYVVLAGGQMKSGTMILAR